MIGIIDYGMGNLRSVEKALGLLGHPASIIRQADRIAGCAKLIVPGVGAFADAIANLRDRGFVDPIRRWVADDKPMLGICLGLQLLFEVSEEDGEHEGLGLVAGRVVRFDPADRALKVPHMGWNALEITQPDNPLYAGLPGDAHVYFVHSYYAAPADDSVIATRTDYDGPFCSSIRRGNLFATQFHPEKSQRIGLKMLANFAGL